MNRTASSAPRRRTARRIVAIGILGAAVLVTGLVLPGILSAPAAIGGVAAPARTTPTAGPPTAADGLIAQGQVVSVFAHVPAVTNLNPQLLGAVRRAATDAAADGIHFQVNSGWRSPKLQEAMLQQAIAQYGSKAAAERWVATPEGSEHVKGDAIDIGPWAADDWLSRHGAAYGLCQIYANEAWHYELRPQAATDGCPAMYADPSEDPRLQK